jgi:hypothetical protein
MKASSYRSLLWELIAASDTGKYDKLSIDDVRLHAREGTISQFLQEQFTDADFSLLKDEDWKSLDTEVASMDNAIDASRKFGVKNRGLSLLMAWALQGVRNEKA